MAREIVYLKIRVLAMLVTVIAVTNATDEAVIQAGRAAIIKKFGLPSSVNKNDHTQAQTAADTANDPVALGRLTRIEVEFSDVLYGCIVRFPLIEMRSTIKKTVSNYLDKKQTIQDIKEATQLEFLPKEYNINTIGIGADSYPYLKNDKKTLWVGLSMTIGFEKINPNKPNADLKKSDKSTSRGNFISNLFRRIPNPFSNKKNIIPKETSQHSSEASTTGYSTNQPIDSGNSVTSKPDPPIQPPQCPNAAPSPASSSNLTADYPNSVMSNPEPPQLPPHRSNVVPSQASLSNQTTGPGNMTTSKLEPPVQPPQPSNVTPSPTISSTQPTSSGNMVVSKPKPGTGNQFVFDENDTTSAVFTNEKFVRDSLAAQNRIRARHFAPPFILSKQLCDLAESWVMANANGLKGHNPNRFGCGENIHWSMGLTNEGDQAPEDWEFEKYNYFPGDQTEPRGATGHFTQLVWKGEGNENWTVGEDVPVPQYVGVAIGPCKHGKYNGHIVVANYYPAGNMMVAGYFERNVSDTNPPTPYISPKVVQEMEDAWRNNRQA